MSLTYSMVRFSEALAEETGIHVGDGSMNIYSGNRSFYTVACHYKDDKEYLDTIVLPLINKVYGKTPKPRNWSQGTYGFRICSKSIISFKHDILGLPLGKKSNIEIPRFIRQRRKLMRAFLRGLFDTDGCVYLWHTNNKEFPRIQFNTISELLMAQVKAFLLQEGFIFTTWSRQQKHWRRSYALSIDGLKMLDKWMGEIGFHNPKHLQKITTLKKNVYKAPVSFLSTTPP
jgi:intein/homing endonuclease